MIFRFLVFMLSLVLIGKVNADNFEIAETARIAGDYDKAFKYYEKSIADGNMQAMHWLGIFYYDGSGIEKDFKKASLYFQVAANLGNQGAMVYLANMYLFGNGLPKDCGLAEAWIIKFSQGHPSDEWRSLLYECKSETETNRVRLTAVP